MAESKTPADTSGIAKSLEERLTFPDKKNETGKTSWADDVEESVNTENKKDATSLEEAQKDGANTFLNGSGLDEPAFDVNVKLADLQADPNDPLYSIQSFKDLKLSDELLRALSVNNFHKPSKIQERALPLLMKDPPQNFIGQSQSGTGKTAAFTLNMLSRIDLSNSQPQCLVLAPTRELARQIASNCQMLGVFLEDKGLKIGEAIPNQANRGQQIIVGTPGTVFDMIKRRQLDTRNMKVLTLDEADNMLGRPADHCSIKLKADKRCRPAGYGRPVQTRQAADAKDYSSCPLLRNVPPGGSGLRQPLRTQQQSDHLGSREAHCQGYQADGMSPRSTIVDPITNRAHSISTAIPMRRSMPHC
jgi:hypothetical protein